MKILPISDLHLEFHADYGETILKELDASADLLIIAGDLSTLGFYVEANIHNIDPIGFLCKKYKEVIFVTGNHDYWYSSPKDAFDFYSSFTNPNFHLLENNIKEIDGQRFLGATLWFANPPILARKDLMNDFKAIENFEPWVYEQGAKTIKFLEDNLKEDDIVVTHHMPTKKSTVKAYKNHPLNCFFIHDVEHLILERKPTMWIHGHTHFDFDYYIGDTRIICNPLGYITHENTNFKTNMIISV